MRKDSQFALVIRDHCQIYPFFPNSTFLIMKSCKQQKKKVIFGGSLRGGVAGGVPLMQVVLGGFWVVSDGFCQLRMISDGFRWFAVLVVTPVSKHTEKLTLYYTHGHP